MPDILDRLAAPFPPSSVSWRVGATTKDKSKGLALAYLDSRDIQDRLTEVCGVHWQVRHPWSVGTKLACEIGIKIDDEWIWRGDGAGDSDVEAEKGAFSDSFKRAAVRWGVGRYLYDLKSPWVALAAHGNSYSIADGEYPKLEALLRGKQPIPEARDDRSPADEFFERAKREISEHMDPVALAEWAKVNKGHLSAIPQEKYDLLKSQYDKRMGALASSPNLGKAA